MKISPSLLLLSLTLSNAAFACNHDQNQLICPGDPVVDSGGSRGKAFAVNPFAQTVAINYGGTGNANYRIEQVSLGMGCLEGYCVGDQVSDSGGSRGVVDAVNPYTRTIAINYGGTGDSILGIESVSLALGCIMGYCVGDKVSDQGGSSGTIFAINRYTQTAAINYGGTGNANYNIKTLSSSEYCLTYGQQERRMQAYPEFSQDKYISNNLHFSLSRPVVASYAPPAPPVREDSHGDQYNPQSGCHHSAEQFICPGSKVIDAGGSRGKAAAVNPFNQTVAVNYGGTGNANYAISTLALGEGCLEGYCVGDLVSDSGGSRGVIDGVNPYSRTIAINYGGTGDAILKIESVSIALGCMFGYCVGDKVSDSGGNAGIIYAINRYTGTAAVNYGGSGNANYDIKTLSSTEFCLTYGEQERRQRLFPVFREDRYISPELHFTMERETESGSKASYSQAPAPSMEPAKPVVTPAKPVTPPAKPVVSPKKRRPRH